jgi:SNF2-related domain/SNF2 Helicase protein/Helicase conserved C-terminal domain
VEAAELEPRIEAVAAALVASGRVIPGLTVTAEGRARSWWYPLPAAGDRELVASCCADGSVDAQRDAAARLAAAVDRSARAHLLAAGVTLLAPRPGRRTVPEAWVRSLTEADPWLAPSHNPEKLRAFESVVTEWISSGAAVTGSVRLCLRVCEPVDESDLWTVELLVQDTDDPTLFVPASEVWEGSTLFSPTAVEELLVALGRLARLAPELAGVLDERAPTTAEVSAGDVLRVVQERSATLVDAGIGVLLPSWWTKRGRIGLRAKASSSRAPSGGVAGGVAMDALVSFEWQAALGGHRLTRAELRVLARAADAKRSLVRVRGEWIELRAEDLAAVRTHAGTRGEAAVADVLRAGLGLETLGLPDGVEVTGVEATGWLGALLDDALHNSITPVATPADFRGELRPYQERGVGWLAFLGQLGLGACLADDMGLGKTAQLLATVLVDPAPGPTIVLCPVSVLGNWEHELARFAPGLRVLVHHGPARFDGHRAKFATRVKKADVVLTTYSLVARDIEQLAPIVWGRLVLDEAQQIKNPSTAQARAVQRLRASRRVALTGTPVENRLAELWSIMHVLNPGLLGSARAFRDRFAAPIEREQDPEATASLRRMTAPFVLRRLKSDRSIVSDLPDKIETTNTCLLTREQATLYRAVVDELVEQSDASDGMSRRGLVLAGLTRLKQVCNHPAQFLHDGSALGGRSGKLARIEELLDEILAEGDKALCFTQFTEWGELLVPYLSRRFGVQTLWLHGGVRRSARDTMVARFQDTSGPPLFLVSLKAGGTGLNLTAASHVLHLDRWWNPAVEDQATDRAYRIGQHRTVQVHKLVNRGTVEERIGEMINRKRALAEKVVGASEQWITELSTADLREVVELRDDALDDSSDDDAAVA